MKNAISKFYVIQDQLDRYFVSFADGSLHFTTHLDDAKFFNSKIDAYKVLGSYSYFNDCQLRAL